MRAGASRWGIALLLAWIASAAAAEQPAILPHSAALACLTPLPAERGAPEYDPDALERKHGGIVPVELVFDAPDRAPLVRVLDDGAVSSLVESVRRHVRRYRVPCMNPDGNPVRLQFEFDFRPDDARRVVSPPPRDADAERQAKALRCLTRIEAGQRPEYPRRALELETQGVVLARLHFTSSSEPPKFTALAGTRSPHLRASVERFVQGYRLPCLEGAPVTATIAYDFFIEGATRYVINDMPLQRLVRFARSYPKPFTLDLTPLGCPFDLSVAIRQPYADNLVYEYGDAVPGRLPLLRWLEQIEVNVKPEELEHFIGRSFKVNVPCGRIEM